MPSCCALCALKAIPTCSLRSESIRRRPRRYRRTSKPPAFRSFFASRHSASSRPVALTASPQNQPAHSWRPSEEHFHGGGLAARLSREGRHSEDHQQLGRCGSHQKKDHEYYIYISKYNCQSGTDFRAQQPIPSAVRAGTAGRRSRASSKAGHETSD